MYYKIYNIFDKYSKPLCEWVSANNMTDKEKTTKHRATQGYLKVNKEKYNGIEIAQKMKSLLESSQTLMNKFYWNALVLI